MCVTAKVIKCQLKKIDYSRDAVSRHIVTTSKQRLTFSTYKIKYWSANDFKWNHRNIFLSKCNFSLIFSNNAVNPLYICRYLNKIKKTILNSFINQIIRKWSPKVSRRTPRHACFAYKCSVSRVIDPTTQCQGCTHLGLWKYHDKYKKPCLILLLGVFLAVFQVGN